MTVGFHIVDAGGNNTLKVNGEGEIGVTIHSHPPLDEEVTAYPFAGWFTNDGTQAGSNELAVDGSTTPQEFYISSLTDRDIFIKTLSIEITAAGAALNEFGNESALSNGVDWKYSTTDLGDIDIVSGIQTNWDLVRMGGGNPAIGDGTSAFRANNVSGNNEGYTPFIDIATMFGFTWGLRLKKGSTDVMKFVINDDISGVNTFNIRAFGVQL